MFRCEMCGSTSMSYMGKKGKMMMYSCRHCGAEYSKGTKTMFTPGKGTVSHTDIVPGTMTNPKRPSIYVR